MKQKNWLVLLISLLLCTTPLFGLVVKSGDDIEIRADEVIDDDIIVLGQNVAIKGTINGNVCAFSQDVEITGDVAGTIFCGGANVNIDAQSVGTIWAGAGNVKINGNIRNNVLVFGGALDIEEDTKIGKDLIIYGGKVKVAGEIAGTVKGGVGTFVMSGKSCCVDIDADKITIKSGALITGDLLVESDQKPIIEDGAEILGETKLKSAKEVDVDEKAIFALAPVIAFFIALFKILVFITKIIVGIVLIAVSRSYVRRLMDTMLSKPWHCLGWGFVGLIVIPVAVIILLSLIIGYPFAILGIYVYTIIFYLASIFAGLVIGEKIIKLFKKEGDVSLYLSFIVGMVVLLVLGFIPILGFIVKIIVLLFGSGMVLLGSWNLIRDIRAKKLI
ncbi:MAG: hypothetical protein WBB37_03355 [bacterium]